MIKVGLINTPPFKKTSEKLDEVFYRLFVHITNNLNLSMTPVFPTSGLWGENKNGTWDGLVGDLIKENTDVAISSLAQTDERERYIDFSYPIYIYHPVFLRYKQ